MSLDFGLLFRWDSDAFTIPERAVVPRPLQEPHPPLWIACSGEEGLAVAVQRGLAGVTQLVMSHGVWGRPDDQKLRSVELFGRGVVPQFRAISREA